MRPCVLRFGTLLLAAVRYVARGPRFTLLLAGDGADFGFAPRGTPFQPLEDSSAFTCP